MATDYEQTEQKKHENSFMLIDKDKADSMKT